MTLDEVADKLVVSVETARKLCVIGKLPWVPVGTGSSRMLRRVRASTLAAYMQNERRGAIKQQMHAVRRMRLVSETVEERW